MKRIFMLLVSLVGIAFADTGDPAWFTAVTVALAAILVMVGTALSAKISIELVPLAWSFVKRVIGR